MKLIPRFKQHGFTLIELLIVVAIIAILAAIAVPNFLEAQTRAKISRVRADHRTIATGLEVYKVDTNKYPWCAGNNWCFATGAGSQTKNRELPGATVVTYAHSPAARPQPAPVHPKQDHKSQAIFPSPAAIRQVYAAPHAD